jgi:VanZ family protein
MSMMSMSPSFKRLMMGALLLGTLLCVFYFALVPNVRRDVLNVLPAPIRSWCGLNDDGANFALFAILGFLGFSAANRSPDSMGVNWTGAARCLAVMLMLVVVLEFVQRWIPGRYSSVRDVVMGGSGVFAGWFSALVASFMRQR